MATMDKNSVRDKFDQLKSDFNILSKTSKVSPEIKAVVNGLILLMEMILSIFMEKKTPKTSKNSGKPPSQTEKDNTSLEGSKGKGVKENNLVATNTRTVETITVAPADCCDQCGESLRKTPSQCHERRTRIDIIFEKNH